VLYKKNIFNIFLKELLTAYTQWTIQKESSLILLVIKYLFGNQPKLSPDNIFVTHSFRNN